MTIRIMFLCDCSDPYKYKSSCQRHYSQVTKDNLEVAGSDHIGRSLKCTCRLAHPHPCPDWNPCPCPGWGIFSSDCKPAALQTTQMASTSVFPPWLLAHLRQPAVCWQECGDYENMPLRTEASSFHVHSW